MSMPVMECYICLSVLPHYTLSGLSYSKRSLGTFMGGLITTGMESEQIDKKEEGRWRTKYQLYYCIYYFTTMLENVLSIRAE